MCRGELGAGERHPAADDSVAVPRCRCLEQEAILPKGRTGLQVRGLGRILVPEVAAVDRAGAVRIGEGDHRGLERERRGGGGEAEVQAADQVAAMGVHLLRRQHAHDRHWQARLVTNQYFLLGFH